MVEIKRRYNPEKCISLESEH
ncbi:MAG TPA: hypothetical protein VFN58_02205 [Candidatus Binatia bacterium]|nr:hypothetical protein [Candidatus Binatia bacterium]